MNKLFIDLETTGLPKTKGFNDWYDYTDLEKYDSSRIIEIGLILTDNEGVVIEEYSSMVKPDNFTGLKPIITQITGITDDDINSHGRPLYDVLEETRRFFEDTDTDIIISYNIGFDMNILLSELHRINQSWLFKSTRTQINNKNKECAMELSKTVLNLERHKKMCDVYKLLFNVESNQDHRALSDTRICKDVYLKLKSMQNK